MIRRGRNYVMPTERRCSKCDATKLMDGFYRRSGRPSGRTSVCKSCVAEMNAGRCRRGAWKPMSPERTRRQNLARYGLTPEIFDAMLVIQGGVCAVCAGPPMSKGRYHVDHSHLTGLVRGLLCHKCNVALGMVSDDPLLLRRLADYLEAHYAADLAEIT